MIAIVINRIMFVIIPYGYAHQKYLTYHPPVKKLKCVFFPSPSPHLCNVVRLPTSQCFSCRTNEFWNQLCVHGSGVSEPAPKFLDRVADLCTDQPIIFTCLGMMLLQVFADEGGSYEQRHRTNTSRKWTSAVGIVAKVTILRTCRNCVGTVRTILETVLETVGDSLKTVGNSLRKYKLEEILIKNNGFYLKSSSF